MTDVIIIGAGPAGSILGSYLSKAGVSNVIFEKSHHPRPHVGESLVPSTTRIFQDIGFLETMETEGFVKKYGASWHPYNRRGEFDIEFKEFPQKGVGQDYTYHVDRAKFDMLLLKHAQGLGSRVYQGVHVQEVLFDNGKASGVRFKIGDQNVEMPAKLIVDATGRDTLLGRQLNLKDKDPIFNQYAVHAWFENLDKGNGKTADYIHIYFLPVERGWVWQIPISETVSSIGVVVEKEVFKGSKMNIEDYFFTHVNSNSDLKNAMKPAKRINDFKTEGDYSYKMNQFCGDGFVMIGDAARFVDPIFSSGISVASYSAKFASEAIIEALKTGDFSEAALKPYETKLKSGTEIWYEFIRLYYKLLHLFTYFIDSKEHRLEVLQLLQGDVYEREEAPVLRHMREFVEKVENTDDHVFKKHLTDIPID